eukprot:5980916-Heterocapsa_arctica.AAC.1
MIINDCKPNTERLGKKETYENVPFQSMEAYSDHGSIPELHWHQERQNMKLLLIKILNDGGPSLIPRLGKSI